MFLRSLCRYLPLLASSACSLPFLCDNKKNTSVFMWGNGVYQARPDALLQFTNFSPKKIQNLPKNLVRIQFGQYFEAGIDDSGSLWIWKNQILDANPETNSTQDYERKDVKLLVKNIKEVKFTTGYLWTLTNKNQVVQYPIIKQFNNGVVVGCKIGKQRTVEPLKGAKQICTGNDHILALSKDGQVLAMGDDTYGQCGTNDINRPSFPPFQEHRVSYPIKPFLKNIVKIACGANHSLALDDSGSLFGWGSNSNMQLSHQYEFSQMNTPLLASFKPLKISKNLDNSEILDIKAGEEFTVILAKNRLNQSFEVFSVGSNLKGQLGIGEIRHVRDITKVQALSNFVLKRGQKMQQVQADQVACGRSHCIARLNINYVMQWGDNQHGQMGNKKRSSAHTPIIVRQFSNKQILGVFAGQNCSGVILRQAQTEKKA